MIDRSNNADDNGNIKRFLMTMVKAYIVKIYQV